VDSPHAGRPGDDDDGGKDVEWLSTRRGPAPLAFAALGGGAVWPGGPPESLLAARSAG
jgi:hypothetical protein